MITRVQKSKELGDCTIWYDIHMDKEYTISQFIQETKSLDNYARYNIAIRKWAETQVAESSYGKVKYKGDCSKKIMSAEANGGYGLMSYYLYV